MYPNSAGSYFDLDYYLATHVPLVKSRLGGLGLQSLLLLRGATMLDGSPATYQVIAQLTFASLHQLQDALGKHGDEIIANIPRYTNVQPIIQINETLDA